MALLRGGEGADGGVPIPVTPWEVYYRGSLSSCNYACGYCPFAKTANTRAELVKDRKEVERFVAWVQGCSVTPLSILFTPWGEALGHRYYRQALVALSRSLNVRRVCIQTNLSAPLTDLGQACPKTLTLWATYHPGQISRARFLSRCRQLTAMGIRFSVGVVGMREHLDEIEALRTDLWTGIYLWVNAYKREAEYYSEVELQRIRAVDPLFDANNQRYPSLGRGCRAGDTHFTVDGRGDVRRCHFVGEVIGNLYDGSLEQALHSRPCPVQSCGCYIGYIHLQGSTADGIYGKDRLGRIPSSWDERGPPGPPNNPEEQAGCWPPS